METASQPATLEGVVRPLDKARRALLRASWRVPVLGGAMRSVESRVPLLAMASVAFSLVLACLAPGVLFVLGPALFGVLHVASDVRYLVLRRRLPASWSAAVALGSAALIGIRVVEWISPNRFPFAFLEVSTGWAWVALGAWMGAWATHSSTSRSAWRDATLVTLPIAAVALMAGAHPLPARALLAYGHNLVAPMIWLVLFRDRKIRAVLPLLLVGASTCFLLAGVTVPLLRLDGPWTTAFIAEARGTVSSLPRTTALGIGLSYVFLQAVHYSIWLVLIPQEQIRGNATLTFRMSLRSARRDFGALGLAIIAAAGLALLAASFVSVHRTRHFYLSVATFHAYLELACLAFLWTRGPRHATSAARQIHAREP
jgi:hypothetical protein